MRPFFLQELTKFHVFLSISYSWRNLGGLAKKKDGRLSSRNKPFASRFRLSSRVRLQRTVDTWLNLTHKALSSSLGNPFYIFPLFGTHLWSERQIKPPQVSDRRPVVYVLYFFLLDSRHSSADTIRASNPNLFLCTLFSSLKVVTLRRDGPESTKSKFDFCASPMRQTAV